MTEERLKYLEKKHNALIEFYELINQFEEFDRNYDRSKKYYQKFGITEPEDDVKEFIHHTNRSPETKKQYDILLSKVLDSMKAIGKQRHTLYDGSQVWEGMNAEKSDTFFIGYVEPDYIEE